MQIRRTLKWVTSFLLGALLVAISAFLAVGCRALFPKQVDGDERLAGFPTASLPLEAPVTIYWNDFLVPYIVAGSDRDLAFSLGLFHGYFREAQLEILRKISQGRIAEMAGPVAAEIDAALRRLNYGKAAEETLRTMDPDTRVWLEAYVEGINHAIIHSPRPPPETSLLGLDREPFTATDLLTFGRLAGTDVNWLTLFTLLSERDSPRFAEILDHVNAVNAANTASFSEDEPTAPNRTDSDRSPRSGATSPTDGDSPLPGKAENPGTAAAPPLPPYNRSATASSESPRNPEARSLLALVNALSRSGSNTVALSPEKTAEGYALIANDPHLGQSLPNFWTVVGMKSPGYQAVGLMIPGLPFLGLGRNEDIAWGGTNMRAASSDFVDVSEVPVTNEYEETLRIRFWPDRRITVRETEFGPILSDADIFPSKEGEDIALRWMGHLPSDEISAFLRANRARSVREFLDSFGGYAVSGQNMIAVDRAGNIGMVLALTLPDRENDILEDILLSPSESPPVWENLLDADDLPKILNPASGFLASANNTPVRTNPPIGFLFGEGERIDRLHTLLSRKNDWTVADLEELQRDVFSPTSYRLSRELLQLAPQANGALLQAVEAWDGTYTADSEGAVAFELWLNALIESYPSEKYEEDYFRDWSYLGTQLPEDIESLQPESRDALYRKSLAIAQTQWEEYPTWGDLHRLRVGHLLAALPGLGRFFVYDRFPAAGSRETVYKTAHGLVDEPHDSRYGSQSRHISSMADADDNWFVLFGGQDGWIGSEHFADQIPLWRKGEYLHIPLREETVAKEFTQKMVLQPE